MALDGAKLPGGVEINTTVFRGELSEGMMWLDVIIALVFCTIVSVVSMTLTHAVMARFRVEQVFKFFWTVVRCV